jgi:hypothetical protein
VKADVGLPLVDNTADASKNVLSATKLTTPRNINGVPFDGTANITVADATKEPALPAGTASQYLRGDKTWQTLPTTTPYVLPPATATVLGGVKQGTGVTIAADGTISSTDAVTSVAGRTGAVVLTKTDVGLPLADNTADATKVVASSAKLTTPRTINGVAFDGTANVTIPVASADAALYEKVANKGVANGYAALDATTRLPAAQLPLPAVEYKGTWNATTNSPTLANGVGNMGDMYRVSTAGTQLGVTVGVGDVVFYDGTTWHRLGAASATTYQVRSEKGAANGYASLDATTRLPDAQLPLSVVQYKGTVSGTARVVDPNPVVGDMYRVDTAGVINGVPVGVNDVVMYDGTDWNKLGAADATTYQARSEKAAANGYASLDATTRLPDAQLPLSAVTLDGTQTVRNKTLISPKVADGLYDAGTGGLVLNLFREAGSTNYLNIVAENGSPTLEAMSSINASVGLNISSPAGEYRFGSPDTKTAAILKCLPFGADKDLVLESRGLTGAVKAKSRNGASVEVDVKGHKHVAADVVGARSWATVPSSATATGTAGQEAYDAGFHYVCVATNTWKRTALTTW